MGQSAMRRTVRESLVEMTEIVLPEDTNAHGSIFGGRVLSLIDKCAAVVATRHARSHVLTVSLDSVEFRTPVHLGDVLVLHGRINAAFRSSMEIEVEVHAEVPTSGKRRLTTTAFVTLVAIDATGHPTRAPALELANDDERRRFEAAAERRAARLANR